MHTIGITGVGGGVGQGVIKALQDTSYRLVGMDGEILGTGLYAVDEAYTIPYANDTGFVEAVMEVCRKEKITVLFPGLDAELYKFSEYREAFASVGTTVMVSDAAVVDISENKWSTFEKLASHGFNVPATYKLSDVGSQIPLPFPYIIKPFLGGARSKDVFLIQSREQHDVVIHQIANRIDRFIIQEFLEGEEYTCGTVTLGGKCRGAIVMKRELRSGDTYKCHSINDTSIQGYLVDMMDVLQPFGACNVQLKLKDGLPCIFEINARCSGTTAARALCGFNEPRMIADFILEGKEPVFEILEKTILRYWNELVIDRKVFDDIATKGCASVSNRLRL